MIVLRALCLAAVVAVVGCATPDEVIFVTATEVGIGADATMGTVNIGYDRNELVVGPAYPETGGLPPVYAKLNSDLAAFNPRIQQIYATGEAARLATDPDRSKPDGQALYGHRKIMTFGTTTNFGLKVHFVGEGPTSFNFGYKRKEFSVLPLQSDTPTPEDPDRYGSVIAGIALRVASAQLADTGIDASQFIATGDAADNLASTDDIRALYRGQAQTALARAAVMGVPAANVSLQEQAQPICQKSLQRAGNPDLNAQLAQIEQELGYTIGEFCANPTSARLAAIRAKMRERGLL